MLRDIKKIDALSNKEILIEIINKFKIDEKIISVGDIDERLTKLEYFVNNATNLNNFGMDIYSLSNYFEELLTGGTEIKMSINKSSSNSVKIMTIHKSKGLEFNVVYMPYLNSDFTKSGSKSSFKYSNNYGIITPYCEEYSGNTFISDLDKQREYIEELSERIRLFYVALTRAKEKIILIDPFTSKIEPAKNNITYSDITTVKSYSDLLSLIKNKVNKYIKEVNLDSIGLTKEYNLFKSFDYKNKINASNNTLNVKELNIDNKLLENKHFSKALSKVIDKDLARTLDFGTYMHYVFEVFDFKNGSIDDFDVDNEVKNCLTNFFKHEEVANIKNANIYKEYEIRFESNGATYHGFIDLLVEYDDHFDIIDYKLSNINSEEYKVQLNGYKDYIESRFNKPTNIYLYSIKKDIFKKLN